MEPIAPRFSLKDHLFNRAKVRFLANCLKQADSSFNSSAFVRVVMSALPVLELKARIKFIAVTLESFLPEDFDEACAVITRALPPPLDPSQTDDDFGDFIFAPLGEFVARNGCNRKNLKTSFKTLHALTQRFSMEDAMRPFINAYPKETIATYQRWVSDHNYHVRRLVSESLRPFLPWSKRLTIDHTAALPFLTILHADKTRYVTRSVANHVNDLTKIDAELALTLLCSWQEAGEQKQSELVWLTKHALRNLIKLGSPEALALVGVPHGTKAQVVGRPKLRLARREIRKNDTLSFSLTLQGVVSEPLLVDYMINFRKANGGTKAKVFKLKQINIREGELFTITKHHRFRDNATTYKLYSGRHQLTIQVNGVVMAKTSFTIH